MAERINAVKTSFFGKGAIRLLGPELQKMGIRRALLVTDRFLYDSVPLPGSVRYCPMPVWSTPCTTMCSPTPPYRW